MNYQVLARKWRPRTFVEVVGQQLVLQALHNALAAGVVHHAYLFTGDRGVGKTTITRIIAKCLNCAQGITTEPCGSCDSCLAIDAGKHMDVIEVDAASRTKVEDTRSLLENVAYAPTSGRFKVYIIDEVHMLSNHSFNALLKTLEEPPSHVKFLLATTDPKKLPVTILSRCLQFHLRNFTQRQITQHLGKVLAAEGVAYTEAALNRLSQAAGGSMRDALMLLEQAIALSMPSKAQGSESIRQEQAIQTSQDDANILNEGQASRAECETKYSSEITLDLVLQMLGTVGEQVVLALLLAIVKSDSARAFEIIVELELQAADFKSVIQELQGLLHKIAVLQVLPEYQEQQIDSVENTRDELSVLANSILPQDVQVLYQVALHGLRDLPYAPSMRLGFEMLVLRMLCFQPIKVCAVGLESAEKHDTSKTDIETKNLTQEHKDAESCQAKVIPKALQVAIRSQDQVNSEPSRQQRRSLKGEGYNVTNTKSWSTVVSQLNLAGILKVIIESSELLKWQDNNITLLVPGNYKHSFMEQHKAKLGAALAQYLQVDKVKLEINFKTLATNSLIDKDYVNKADAGAINSSISKNNNDENQKNAVEGVSAIIGNEDMLLDVAMDPNIKKMQSMFQAEIEEVTAVDNSKSLQNEIK